MLSVNKSLLLKGETVTLEEICPKYFPYVISWRNNKELNKYLNQPTVLTLESQRQWYEQHYLKDNTQGFVVMIDKDCDRPFATLGWTDLDRNRRQCIMGRLLLGDASYGKSVAFLEGILLLSEFLYDLVDIMYIHVGVKNKKALRINKRLGFVPNEETIQFPHELYVQGDKSREQREFYRTRDMFYVVKKKFFDDIHDNIMKNNHTTSVTDTNTSTQNKIMNYTLRPLEEKDLPLILEWRNSDRVHSQMLTNHRITWDEHYAWFQRMKEQSIRRNFVFEYRGKPIGYIGYIEFDEEQHSCSPGAYLGENIVAPKDAALCLFYASIEYAFTELNMKRLNTDVFADNKRALTSSWATK